MLFRSRTRGLRRKMSSHPLSSGLKIFTGVYQVVVMVNAFLVDGRAGHAEWQDPRPADAERIVGHTRGGEASDVLLVHEVVEIGDCGERQK